MSAGPVRIAMWSGPRNISTAMMRSFGSRPDAFVTDEPLYAHYLQTTRRDHPGAREVLAHQETDWRSVVEHLTGPVPGGAAVWYQKHMAHHLVGDIELDWIDGLTNCLLVREPRAMLASLARVLGEVTVEETGLPQQVMLYERLAERGAPPPVIVSSDVLKDPRGMLSALCGRVGIAFDDAMLSWEAGLRETDGVWAKHWYASVAESTGFAPWAEQRRVEAPGGLEDVLGECEALYAQLTVDVLRG